MLLVRKDQPEFCSRFDFCLFYERNKKKEVNNDYDHFFNQE